MGVDPLRVYVACDISNLWKDCREKYGSDARVDFEVLRRIVPSIFPDQEVHQEIAAFIVTPPEKRNDAFERTLENFGYEIHWRPRRFLKTGPIRADCGIDITIDAIDRCDDYDLFVLVSGDGDFSTLLEYLGETLDKETMVLTFQHSLSAMLHRSADRVYYFNRDIVYLKNTA